MIGCPARPAKMLIDSWLEVGVFVAWVQHRVKVAVGFEPTKSVSADPFPPRVNESSCDVNNNPAQRAGVTFFRFYHNWIIFSFGMTRPAQTTTTASSCSLALLWEWRSVEKIGWMLNSRWVFVSTRFSWIDRYKYLCSSNGRRDGESGGYSWKPK